MKFALATSGLWRLRDAVELHLGGKACRSRPFGTNVDAIAGWGHKPTAANARSVAWQKNLPYIAFEDGFLRSVRPGNEEKPLSLVMDRTGIYYDARQPSDLEAYVRSRSLAPSQTRLVQEAMMLLQRKRLSKYNNFDMHDVANLNLHSADRKDCVLVVDQTVGDASIPGAFAEDDSFGEMLETAILENPAAEFIIRIHPETMMGRKAGHFTREYLHRLADEDPVAAKLTKDDRLRLTPESINPWALLEACSKVYCVSSQLGFEALLAGCEVHCFGVPFYAGWGLTCDRNPTVLDRRISAPLEALFAAVYFDYSFYFDHENKKTRTFFEAVEYLGQRVNDQRQNSQ
jgi:capsular polysaccharide export protein